MVENKSLEKLKVKIFADGADIERIILLDKKNFTGDMGLIMGGLFDENPSIVQNKFTSDVIDNISSKINYEVKKDNLTNEELNNVINRGNIRLWDKEWMYKGRDMHYKA